MTPRTPAEPIFQRAQSPRTRTRAGSVPSRFNGHQWLVATSVCEKGLTKQANLATAILVRAPAKTRLRANSFSSSFPTAHRTSQEYLAHLSRGSLEYCAVTRLTQVSAAPCARTRRSPMLTRIPFVCAFAAGIVAALRVQPAGEPSLPSDRPQQRAVVEHTRPHPTNQVAVGMTEGGARRLLTTGGWHGSQQQ